jgi:predicted GIY-YIG superfamily endonuclease
MIEIYWEKIASKLREYLLALEKILNSKGYSFCSETKSIPLNSGVYIILNHSLMPIYIGRTLNLRRRLFRDHRSGNVDGSAFRRALSIKLGIQDEKELRSYIEKNCSFKYLTLKNTHNFEHFAISVLSPELNK